MPAVFAVLLMIFAVGAPAAEKSRFSVPPRINTPVEAVAPPVNVFAPERVRVPPLILNAAVPPMEAGHTFR